MKGHWQEVGGVASLTSGVIDHEGVHSPRYSLKSHTEEAAEQSGKEGISKILCNAANVLCIYTPAFTPFLSFLPQKKVRPAVKWCNPDAVTMLLSVNHQRHHLFFKGKKVGAFDELKVFLICRGI